MQLSLLTLPKQFARISGSHAKIRVLGSVDGKQGLSSFGRMVPKTAVLVSYYINDPSVVDI